MTKAEKLMLTGLGIIATAMVVVLCVATVKAFQTSLLTGAAVIAIIGVLALASGLVIVGNYLSLSDR